jgi:hypothetical protein
VVAEIAVAEGNADRFDLLFLQLGRQLLELLFIWLLEEDFAISGLFLFKILTSGFVVEIDSFGYFETNIGQWWISGVLEIEYIGSGLMSDAEKISESLGEQHSIFASFPLQQGIGGNRRS